MTCHISIESVFERGRWDKRLLGSFNPAEQRRDASFKVGRQEKDLSYLKEGAQADLDLIFCFATPPLPLINDQSLTCYYLLHLVNLQWDGPIE